jgi:hypothetical protein
VWALVSQIRGNKRADLRTLAVCTFAIALIAGLRWYSESDYEPYVEIYNDTPTLSQFNQESITSVYGEAGYLFISAIFKSFGSGFFLLAFGCAFASMFLKSAVVRRLSGQASLAMALYLCLHFITIEFIQMRWAVAVGLLSLAFCFQYLQRYKAAVLCFALAPAFHYFSILFWIVALLVTLKGYRRFYLLFLGSIVGALFLKLDYFYDVLMIQSGLNVVFRLTEYVKNPDYNFGLFSYAKVAMYPAIYALCVWYRPSFPWKTDRLNLFLFKLSFVSLSATLLGSFFPVLFLRTVVVADFFSIIWILNAIDKAFEREAKLVSFGLLGALFGVWYLVDLANYMHSGYLRDYHTWLTPVTFCALLLCLVWFACIRLWTGLAREATVRP